MNKKISKTEAKKQIDFFFSNFSEKSSADVRKIKRLANSQNISLKANRKKFCKKCFSPYKNPKIRIKSNVKKITCGNCGYVSRWRIKPS